MEEKRLSSKEDSEVEKQMILLAALVCIIHFSWRGILNKTPCAESGAEELVYQWIALHIL